TERAAFLQRLERGREDLVDVPRPHPVVDVAEGEHEIDATLGRKREVVRQVEPVQLDLPEDVRLALDALGDRLRSGDDQLPLRSEVRSEDLGVPTSSGPELDDGLVLLETEERERL